MAGRARPLRHHLDTISALRAALRTYQHWYNTERPHRALGGKTPAAAFTATVKARPADRPLPAPVSVTHPVVSSAGNLSVGTYLINIGQARKGHTLTAITDGDHIAIFDHATLVRVLDADPTRRYQPAEPGRPQGRHASAH